MSENNLDKTADYECEETLDEQGIRKAEFEQHEQEWTLLRKNKLNKMFELIGQSYMAGMTIIEIKRAMGGKSVRGIIKTLSIAGLIENLPVATNKKYKLPENLRYAFERIGFPFVHWCHCNGYDPKEATAALQRDPMDAMPEKWKAIHVMASIDFPVAYADEFQVDPPEYKPGYRRERDRPSVSLNWNIRKMWYCGTIADRPEIVVYGKNMDDVYNKLKDYCNIVRQANRLEAALERFELPSDSM